MLLYQIALQYDKLYYFGAILFGFGVGSAVLLPKESIHPKTIPQTMSKKIAKLYSNVRKTNTNRWTNIITAKTTTNIGLWITYKLWFISAEATTNMGQASYKRQATTNMGLWITYKRQATTNMGLWFIFSAEATTKMGLWIISKLRAITNMELWFIFSATTNMGLWITWILCAVVNINTM